MGDRGQEIVKDDSIVSGLKLCGTWEKDLN